MSSIKNKVCTNVFLIGDFPFWIFKTDEERWENYDEKN